ncbi:MAG: LamG-like jellyroll fold domain-containing protein, partial [Limisphaerales bacterium]
MASLMTGAVLARAQSTYSNEVMSLNAAGYWPMHEVESASRGDIETNYGSLGLLGTGFYPDWATPANGMGFRRGVPGALANDPDSAVYFTYTGTGSGGSSGPSAYTFTNTLDVPHTSPLSTLTPPFSVECWFYPTNGDSQDIWGQDGYEGFNKGNAGSGAGSCCGVRLVWENSGATGFQIYTYKNSSTAHSIGFSGVTGQNLSPIGNWYHLVVTCDSSTNFTLWTNGVVAFTASGTAVYSPDYWTPLTIGGGRGGTKAVTGNIDEFAVYTNEISDVYQHYQDGISESVAGVYVDAVMNDNPAIYLRMDAPANYSPPALLSTLLNCGTTNGVAVADGVYSAGTMPGAMIGPVGPDGVPLQGLSGSVVPILSGMSSFGDAGSAPVYNPTGSNANFTVTALFRGNPCDNRVQSIVGHGTNSWQLSMAATGWLVFNAGNGNKAAGGTGSAAGDIRSVGVYNDGYWHQVVAVNQTNVISLYVDGQLDTNGTPSGIATTNIVQGNALDVMIGSDPSYTNSPPGAGRQFAGEICDVAFFTNALTSNQVQGLFNALGVVPYVITQPVTASVNQNNAFTNTVVAGGSGPLSYQWFTNGVALADQTNASLIWNPVLTGDASSDYYVIVTNDFGSATSAVASLTVFSAPTINTQFPVTYSNVLNTNLMTLYAGADPAFTVSGAGLQPIGYYWFTNGVLDGAAGSSNLVLANVQIGALTTYCLLSNALGTATSVVWSASIMADPPNSSGGLSPYPQAVLAAGPEGYWRLNEAENGNGDAGVVAYDYAGGNDAIYTNVILGNSGYNSIADPSDASAEFGEYLYSDTLPITDELAGQIDGIDFGVPTGGNAEFTVEAWVNGFSGANAEIEGGAIVTKGVYGVSDEFNLGIDSTKTHYRFYIRGANRAMYVVGSGSMPAIDGNWHHLVGVCDEANGVASLYYDGQLINTNAIPAGLGLYESPDPLTIGAAASDSTGTNYNDQFYGYISDVAVYNYAMTASQVLAQFASADEPPLLTLPPLANVTGNGSGSLSIAAMAIGTPPIGYQWYDVNGGTNVATGSTNALPLNLTLTVSNVPPDWNNDELELIVTNAYGTTNVYVTLNIVTNPPQITADLPAQVSELSGDNYEYSIGVNGPLLNYQWYDAGVEVAGQTNATYVVTAGAPGSTSYYVIVSNPFGVVTSTVSMFNAFSTPPLAYSYATNILNLNPVGYWPMH